MSKKILNNFSYFPDSQNDDFKIIEKEVEIEYFEIYLDGFSRDGCKRISYCSGDCDRCACLIDIK
ncbi:MAG TPA: hypothetical protein PLF00_02000 [Candidatus Marinimicrobia bacterium]|jgi:hypothetical protein|nr:hypothetical protein [Candidatus Neomarinimicrobiota bacterium]